MGWSQDHDRHPEKWGRGLLHPKALLRRDRFCLLLVQEHFDLRGF
jgi:hypothetical protein